MPVIMIPLNQLTIVLMVYQVVEVQLYKMPVFEYGHKNIDGGQSISGGFVYRGCDFPNLKGKYICSDYSSGNNTWASRLHVHLPFIVPISFLMFHVLAKMKMVNYMEFRSLNDNRIYRIIDPSVMLSTSVSGAISATQFALDTFKITAPITVTGGVLNVTSKNLVVASNVNVNNALQINLIKPGCQ